LSIAGPTVCWAVLRAVCSRLGSRCARKLLLLLLAGARRASCPLQLCHAVCGFWFWFAALGPRAAHGHCAVVPRAPAAPKPKPGLRPAAARARGAVAYEVQQRARPGFNVGSASACLCLHPSCCLMFPPRSVQIQNENEKKKSKCSRMAGPQAAVPRGCRCGDGAPGGAKGFFSQTHRLTAISSHRIANNRTCSG
jgi:hypothetical protein